MHSLGTMLGRPQSEARAASADGAVVVGSATNTGGESGRAFRWTELDGMQDLGALSDTHTSYHAFGVSADGEVVVGTAFDPFGIGTAFIWTATDGMAPLEMPPNAIETRATAISANGETVSGWCEYASGIHHAVVWKAEGNAHDLGSLGHDRSEAHSVSATGAVVVGWSFGVSGPPQQAIRWSPLLGMELLPVIGWWSEATGVSANGATIVGRAAHTSSGYRAFRWDESTGSTWLDPVGSSSSSTPTGISADGRVVVGWQSNMLAFRWTPSSGSQSLGNLGGSVAWAYGVSDDGRVAVGISRTPAGQLRAFRWVGVSTPADYDGDYFLQVTDFLDFLDDFGACNQEPAPCGQYGNPDVNHDGVIDVLDFLDYMDAFGRGC
jgi:probable HAF family extracellular repeat protein